MNDFHSQLRLFALVQRIIYLINRKSYRSVQLYYRTLALFDNRHTSVRESRLASSVVRLGQFTIERPVAIERSVGLGAPVVQDGRVRTADLHTLSRVGLGS
jgi:hypothetical protein